jgi:hypothetical protein
MPNVLQLGEHAAEAIRELNHRTRDRGALADPVEFSWLLADLATMAGRLPQLLDQLDHWLRHEHDTGHLRADNHADPGELVCATTAALSQAEPSTTATPSPPRSTPHTNTSPTQRPHSRQTPKPKINTSQGVSFQPQQRGQFSAAVDKPPAF